MMKTSKFEPYLQEMCPFDTSVILALASLLEKADSEFSNISYDVCCHPSPFKGVELRIFPSSDMIRKCEYRSIRSLPATGHRDAGMKRWALIARLNGRHDHMNAREYVERALELIQTWINS